MNPQDSRLNRVFDKLTGAYATAESISDRVFAKDFDPHLVRLRRHRTRWHLEKLVELGKAEVRAVGDIKLYRRVRR